MSDRDERYESVDSYERVVSRTPFIVRRRVRWGDCDPAGVVFTGRFSEYVLDAVTLFFRDLAGGGPYNLWLATIGVDTPCKGMELAFHHALWPEDEFDMSCCVSTVRAHSFDIAIEASRRDGRAVFSARFSPICISRDVRKRTDIPSALRDALARHQK